MGKSPPRFHTKTAHTSAYSVSCPRETTLQPSIWLGSYYLTVAGQRRNPKNLATGFLGCA